MSELYCETCQDTGEIDETLGGISTSNPHAPCPDCRHRWPVNCFYPLKPRPCLCKLLAFMRFKCAEHRGSRG
jgi:hypothetical protein